MLFVFRNFARRRRLVGTSKKLRRIVRFEKDTHRRSTSRQIGQSQLFACKYLLQVRNRKRNVHDNGQRQCIIVFRKMSCIYLFIYRYFPRCPPTCSFAHAKCKFDPACRFPQACRWYHPNQDKKKMCVICKK